MKTDADERTFAMDLTPSGTASCVLMDGHDISKLLRGVVVRSSVHEATTVELIPARGQSAELIARLPEANISLTVDASAAIDLLERFTVHRSCRTVDAHSCSCGLLNLVAKLRGQTHTPKDRA